MAEWPEYFYPNNCYICRTTRNLKRCSRCHLISYCGSQHQREHWPKHKELCKIILTMMKERRVSHLFENLRGADEEQWKNGRTLVLQEAISRLQRPIRLEEKHMFLFPRACFVCRDSRQEFLKNCPGCPNASFCKDHPSSSIHDKDCAFLTECQEAEAKMLSYSIKTLSTFIDSMAKGTPHQESSTLPISMEEYLDHIKTPVKIPETMKTYLSLHFFKPLTIFGALQKINYLPGSEMSIHVNDESVAFELSGYWEVLLHFLPQLKLLKIVKLGYFIECTKSLKLCNKCTSQKKKVVFEQLSDSYERYFKSGRFKKANIAMFCHWSMMDNECRPTNWLEKLEEIIRFTCPTIFVTKERYGGVLSDGIRSNFSNKVAVVYHGKNEFKPLQQFREWENDRVSFVSDYLVIVGPQKGENLKPEIRPKMLESAESKPGSPTEESSGKREMNLLRTDSLQDNMSVEETEHLKENCELKCINEKLKQELLQMEKENERLKEELRSIKDKKKR